MKERKNNKRRIQASEANSNKQALEKSRTSVEAKAPASSSATFEAANGNDHAQERLSTMHKSPTL